ncbi:MAG: carboxymuconolactone decarboxylase family protein [Longimicrobiales bacterium]
MNGSDRTLVHICIAMGSDDVAGLLEALESAVSSTTGVEVDEALLQCYLFVGFPRVMRAFHVWREIAPVPAPPVATTDEAEWESRGHDVFQRIYGAQHEKLLQNVAGLHPDLMQWMLVEGYGKVLGRAGLTLKTRELCNIALLATQGALPQLYSHLRGALVVGASEDDVEETLTLALARVPGECGDRARDAWKTVLSRRGG